MSYPGNATLTEEMQERILSTFQQTLTAAAAGNRQEATLGCDFILRLDSLFTPARDLLQRLEVGEGPVETADLAAAVGGATVTAPEPAAADTASAPPADVAPAPPAEAAAAPPPVDNLADLDLGLGAGEAQPAAPAAEPPPAEPVMAEPAAPPAAPQSPAVDELDDLDLGLEVGEPAAPEAAPAAAEASEVPAAGPVAEAQTQTAETPATPGAEELDQVDLGGAPPAEPAMADEPAAPAPPVTEEISAAAATAGAADEAQPEPPAAGETAASPPAVESAAPEAPAPPPAPAPENVEISLDSEPAAQLDSESQQRIDDLLTEGQEAFDSGEYQGAIDAWSRIFLIDIDHAEANRRIEEARKLKAEADRRVEEKFHEGLAHLEAGESDQAADSFRAVLEMNPSHLAARDYLEKLDAGEVPVPTELSRPAEAEGADESIGPEDFEALADTEESPKARPDRGTKAVGERVVTVKKSPFKSFRFLAVAALGLIAFGAGGWYLYQNRDRYFPNAGQEEAVPAAPDPLARAKGLHEQGKTAIAIAQLRRLPPGSPQFDEAQTLIAQWEALQTPTETGPDGPSPQELARREALVLEATAAAGRREYLSTSELLSEAATIAPLSGAEVQLLARADDELQNLQEFITLFREGEWDRGLRELWLLHESDPGNRDVTRLLIDSYYNLGLRSLQRQDVTRAAEQFQEALGLSPDDPELLRLADFAATYQARSTDLLYRIYVKYHPFR